MVAYVPPDRVVIMVGASFRTEPLLAAATRVLALARKDRAALLKIGIPPETLTELEDHIEQIKGTWADPRTKKNDTPLQMKEVAELMARARGWMRTLRAIASVNLFLDVPALARAASAETELNQGYVRDVLAELELRVEAARDMKPRVEDVGLTDAFLGRGRALVRQLRTAIGAVDIDAANLQFTSRRLYSLKGNLYLLMKRVCHAARLAFLEQPDRASLYHMDEIEPMLIEPLAPERAPKSGGRAGA